MNVELKMRPYFGVLPLVFKALNRAFSAPNIYIVEAGYLERLVRPPAWEINLEPTISPINAARFGATAFILCFKYSERDSLKLMSSTHLSENLLIWRQSLSFMSYPIEILAASIICWAFSSSRTTSVMRSFISSVTFSRFSTKLTSFEKILLSLTILVSSGKCHENHSFNLIQKVFIFLSNCSMRAIV